MMSNLQPRPAARAHRIGRWLLRGLLLPIALYGGAAFWYSTLTPPILRGVLAILFPALLLLCLLVRPAAPRRIAISCLLAAGLTWYLTDQPRNTRDWAAEYAVPANVIFKGNTAYIENIRNIRYKTPYDYTTQYYNAAFNTDDVTSVDLITSYWSGPAIAHVFLSFGFADGRHLAVSIETRRQKTFPYSAIAGFFHHYELFYVVADERDLIGVRTDIRKERVYVYHLDLSAKTRKALFLNYLHAIKTLHDHPRWYNTLTTNCTTEILTRAGAQLHWRFDWRVLLSGHTAALAYDLGLLDTHIPFADLQRRSLIQRPEGATPEAPDYSASIRRGLPLPPSSE